MWSVSIATRDTARSIRGISFRRTPPTRRPSPRHGSSSRDTRSPSSKTSRPIRRDFVPAGPTVGLHCIERRRRFERSFYPGPQPPSAARTPCSRGKPWSICRFSSLPLGEGRVRVSEAYGAAQEDGSRPARASGSSSKYGIGTETSDVDAASRAGVLELNMPR